LGHDISEVDREHGAGIGLHRGDTGGDHQRVELVDACCDRLDRRAVGDVADHVGVAEVGDERGARERVDARRSDPRGAPDDDVHDGTFSLDDRLGRGGAVARDRYGRTSARAPMAP